MIRVLVVDDEALVRDGLCAIAELAGDIEVVGEAADGTEAISQAGELSPDVILMDVRMPGVDGVDATRRIMSQTRPPKIIMLTTFDHDQYVYAALSAGASGFLLKDVRRGELADAIRAVHGGQTLLAPAITRRLVERFFARRDAGSAAAPLERITAREREVLTLIGHGFTNSEIAERLGVADTTVKTHIARILTKLDLRDRIHAVIVAYETGLVAAGDTPLGPQPDLLP